MLVHYYILLWRAGSRLLVKEGAPKLRIDRISAPVGTGDVWGGCAPHKRRRNVIFKSHFSQFDAFFFLPEVLTQRITCSGTIWFWTIKIWMNIQRQICSRIMSETHCSMNIEQSCSWSSVRSNNAPWAYLTEAEVKIATTIIALWPENGAGEGGWEEKEANKHFLEIIVTCYLIISC